jgi:hypothetical protein
LKAIGKLFLALLLIIIIFLGYAAINDPRSTFYNNHTEETTVETVSETEQPTTTTESVMETENDGISSDTKMKILSFINGKIDPLYETNMTDEEIEAKADEVWAQAEEKFNVTESDILNIMSDSELINKYYSQKADENAITDYDGTLNDNGYGTVVAAISKEALNDYIKALSDKNKDKINRMFQNGEISYEVNDTKINILEKGIATCKVKLLDGINAGITVYVVTEQVTEK